MIISTNQFLHRLVSLSLVFALLCSMIGTASAANEFIDVPQNVWFSEDVAYVSAEGIMNGIGNGQFAPYEYLSRAMMIQIIYNMSGSQEAVSVDCPFEDVDPNAWYATAVNWGYANGIIHGVSSTHFNPEGIVNREQGIVFLYRMAIFQQKNTSRSASLTFYSDADYVADYSRVAVKWAVATGLLRGVPHGTSQYLEPQSPLNRAQAAALITRYCNTDLGSAPAPVPEPDPTPEPGGIDFTPPHVNNDLFTHLPNNHMAYPNAVEGIDVSYAQEDIDWPAVAASGISFAIIRCGNRFSDDGFMKKDDYFDYNIRHALAAGLDVGVYFFSQAITEEEAREEARLVLDIIRPYNFNLPVFYDWEYIGNGIGRAEHIPLSRVSSFAKAFCDVIQNAGYAAGVYYNLSYSERFQMEEISPYVQWFAQWRHLPDLETPFTFWQYGWVYDVPGIKGPVDVNLWFR